MVIVATPAKACGRLFLGFHVAAALSRPSEMGSESKQHFWDTGLESPAIVGAVGGALWYIFKTACHGETGFLS